MTQAPAVATTRVLAIDPSLRSTGYAVLERIGPGKLRALTYGCIKNSPRMLQSGCLVAIRERVADLIAEHRPDCAAFEAIIYVQSFRTAIIMGCARGAALLAAAEKGLPIYEYAPRRVKQAIVGRGGADKNQVGFMVRAILGLTENPSSDAADALAIGMTHFQAAETINAGVGQLEQI
ncbi:MAG: crossover junction endodeoxyribonuclease RuvC [Verrucomicrobiaceae bacterium]|nr:MAG: crossover junction endodeoxyribonuclease RuvC [Verrucomicrobiaceae bacterium]